ncbi:phosphopentomutase [Halalkalibacterium halodurans]|uniref:BH0592 protein n=2 Tax=Halalkalibacterium halodurans TaxID=86665 RepID=Q9KF93_HALH5|nr:phosphopentomutase [Halalkalibacterium halodurans]MED4124548.1 phosphopentomutase [Halalkalibacterium halodurans]MED4161535.1 phosphopentomutase [Halalkalibacterium halodurans]MED4173194.1 phosphopentomutase [Halalkalibacterium halodurans]TPE69357.1 phosphopentomutase [Halalkalibacterium halodurans]BAB04311.1 BH0592 [Halalkalibacterium halodurans C-125]
MKKVTLLVLDGFGVGAMADCEKVKPEDVNANTYKHLREAVDIHIPTLYQLGLGNIVDHLDTARAAYGRCDLAHHGADTFMGHQELMGSKPGVPQKRLMSEVGATIKKNLEKHGYDVRDPVEGAPVLLVNEAVVVGDNLESEVGNIINVVGDFRKLSFEQTIEVGKVVRSSVDTSRVIVYGNKEKTSIDLILSTIKERHPGQWGVDSPKANVYGEGYQVLHLGYGVDYEKQFAHLAEKQRLPVYRIGKTADVIQASGYHNPVVSTRKVLEVYQHEYSKSERDSVFLVNVQETDLAGHKEDCLWYKEVIEEVDRFLASFIDELDEEDLLIITADHGNDPTIGHSNHTREQTPVIIVGPQVRPISIGTRQTMADLAATMADYMGVAPPQYGTSFLHQILR